MNRHARFHLLPIVILLLTALSALAQTEMDVDGLELLLPHHETQAERDAWRDRMQEWPSLDLRSDPPPAGPVRNCAEWEPCTGVMIRYPLGLPYGLLRDLDDDVTLHVVVSSGYQSTAQSNLANNGVDMSKVEFLVRSNDSMWTRDYGPWFIFDGAGELAIVNHTYNRPWRPNDDLIPYYFALQQGLDVYSHDMYHTGGNYMTDGAHVSSSTELVYEEAWYDNGMSEAEVDQLMADYYGIDTYHVLDYIESGGIHHIDTWAKFLDEETVLVKQPWTSHHTYGTLEQRATLLASLPSSTGRNYQVHRIYCYNIGGGDPASYTNSLILNDDIYVPQFGNATYDADALAAYEAAAPGYTVRGYYYSGFLSDDALHCRTKGVMDAGMLLVGHVPIVDGTAGDALISATIHAHSGAAVTDATVMYRHDGGAWQSVAMTPVGGDDYAATIPQPLQETLVHYYITASDASGRTEGMPRTQPAAWYAFLHHPDLSQAGVAPDAPFAMTPAYPNPFNPQVTLSFELHHADTVRLAVFDARGHRVRTLVDGSLGAGHHAYVWDGRDDAGRKLSSGVYRYRLEAAGIGYTRAVTLAK